MTGEPMRTTGGDQPSTPKSEVDDQDFERVTTKPANPEAERRKKAEEAELRKKAEGETKRDRDRERIYRRRLEELERRNHGKLHNITPQQSMAIDFLIMGRSQRETAEAVQASRISVNRWCNWHPEFQAELNRRRVDIINSQTDGIRQIDKMALQRLSDRIEAGDESAVDAWIKMRGIANVDTTKIGPTSSDAIVAEMVEDREARMRADRQRAEIRRLEGLLFPDRESQTPQETRICMENELVERLDRPEVPEGSP